MPINVIVSSVRNTDALELAKVIDFEDDFNLIPYSFSNKEFTHGIYKTRKTSIELIKRSEWTSHINHFKERYPKTIYVDMGNADESMKRIGEIYLTHQLNFIVSQGSLNMPLVEHMVNQAKVSASSRAKLIPQNILSCIVELHSKMDVPGFYGQY